MRASTWDTLSASQHTATFPVTDRLKQQDTQPCSLWKLRGPPHRRTPLTGGSEHPGHVPHTRLASNSGGESQSPPQEGQGAGRVAPRHTRSPTAPGRTWSVINLTRGTARSTFLLLSWCSGPRDAAAQTELLQTLPAKLQSSGPALDPLHQHTRPSGSGRKHTHGGRRDHAPTSSLSVRISFCAAAAAAGTGTPGFPVTSMGAVGKISAGTRLGDTGPR